MRPTWLTARCGLSDRVTFHVGDALHLPFEDEAFDAVFLQHVAMNILCGMRESAKQIGTLLLQGGRLKQTLAVTSIGEQTMVYQDGVTAVSDVSVRTGGDRKRRDHGRHEGRLAP
jgi:SAM-dependent methyltransferase